MVHVRMSVVLSLSLVILWCWAAVGGQETYTILFSESDLFTSQNLGYDVVELISCRGTYEVGKPQLPVLITYVAIPPGTSVEKLEVIGTEDDDIPGRFVIFPVQEPQPIGTQPEDFVRPDPFIYNSYTPYPQEIVQFVQQADLAGQNLAVIAVHPVQFIGAKGRLIFTRSVEFALYLEQTDQQSETPCLSEGNRKKYERELREMVINPEAVSLPVSNVDPIPLTIPSETFDYVIISYTPYASAAQRLADWKTKKGVPARVVTTDEIQDWYGGSGKDEIRQFVRNAHNQWGTIYLLIVGDSDKIPLPTKRLEDENVPGDTYYADFDDDWVTEVHIGRCPANSTSQVTTFVKKVLAYEKDPVTQDYPLKAMFAAFDPDFFTKCETFAEQVISEYVPGRFSVTRVYDSYSGNHETEAVNAINGGLNFVWHADHGDCDVIGFGGFRHDWYLNTSEVDSDLDNNDEMVNLYSLSCHSSAIDECSSIAEHFTVYNPREAGVSYMGNTRYGWYNFGNCGALSGVYWEAMAKSVFNEEHYHLGEAFTDHKNDNPPGGDETMQYIYYELLLCGDPEMPLWLYQPKVMDATYAPQIQVGEQSYTVTVQDGSSGIQGARVCLMKGDEVYAVGTTNVSGQVTLTINPTSDGNMYVTVIAYNYIPCEGFCVVGEMPSVSVSVTPDATVIPRGGSLGYSVTVSNTGSSSAEFEYWTDIILWSGEPYGKNPIFGPRIVTLQPGHTKQGHISHAIPHSAPLKTYSCCGRIGDQPNSTWDEDCFEFTVVEGMTDGHDRSHNWEVLEQVF